MKVFKYLIFLSILSGLFFVIYRQSDEKGFRRWWISFKTAVLIAASAAGLIPVNIEAIEPPGNNNQVYQERIMDDQEFYALEENDQQVSLAKAESNPSGGVHGFTTNPKRPRPVTPPSGGRPVYVPNYRTPPKGVDQGFGAGANPAGGGGAAEFDDQCPAPKKKQQSQKSDRNDFQSDIYNSKKKKQSAEQCELDENVKDAKIEIVSKIKEDTGLVRAAKEACKNLDVQKDINHLEDELAKGNKNPGIGRKSIGNGIIEHRGKNGGRLYIRESDSVIEILAKSGKKKNNQQFVINRLKEIYG